MTSVLTANAVVSPVVVNVVDVAVVVSVVVACDVETSAVRQSIRSIRQYIQLNEPLRIELCIYIIESK